MHLIKNYCLKPLCNPCVWIGCLRSSTIGNQNPPMTISNNTAKRTTPLIQKISNQMSYLAPWQQMCLGKNFCLKLLHKHSAWIWCLWSLTTGNQHPPTPISNNAAKGQLPWSKKISNQTRSYLAPGQWMRLGKNYCHKPLHKCFSWIGCLRSLTTGNQHPPTTIGNNAAKRTTPLIQKISNKRSYLTLWQQMCLGKNYCLKLLHKCCVWIRCLRSLTTGNQNPPTTICNNAAKRTTPFIPKNK